MNENPYRTPEAVVEPITAELPDGASRRSVLAAEYDGPIKFAIVEQVMFAMFAAFGQDGGVLGRRMVASIAVYWLCFLIIALRRPKNPTAVDLVLVKWGFVFLGVVTMSVR